jgi:hypothetical protein
MTHKWSNITLENIWWEAHGLAIAKIGQEQETTLLKFIHQRSACNRRESIYYAFKSPLCHTCSSHVEDHCHIIKCTKCPVQTNLRKKYMSELKDELVILGTNTDTIRTKTTYVLEWLYDNQHITLKALVPDASIYLKHAVDEQKKIRWDQWFNGQISNTWGDIYNHDIKDPKSIIKYPPVNRWGKEVILLTLRFVLDCWYARNKIEHPTDNDHIERAKSKLIDEILWVAGSVEGKLLEKLVGLKRDKLIILPRENLILML